MSTDNRSRQRRRPAPRGAPRSIPAPRPSLPPAVLPFATAARPLSGRLLLALPVVVVLVAIVAFALGIVLLGILLVVGAGVLLAAGARLGAPQRLVTALAGRPVSAAGDARLVNVVEGLCVAYGLATPSLLVLEDPAANAITLGSPRRGAYLVITSGALDRLDRLELEGLVAHELAHLKRGDTSAAGLAMRLLGPLAPLAGGSRLLRRTGDPRREFGADQLGASMTRYPPGLRGALEKLAAAPSRRPAAVGERLARLTAPFWCAPLDEGPSLPVVAGVLDLELRAAALAEL
ncbi:MAG TPA: M48 family metalloprotease [Acidimicrobiales bacterium]|nr:M48 family metalloprotease [Acidimicrobiales bacterium]